MAKVRYMAKVRTLMLKGASSTLRVSLMERTAYLLAQYTPVRTDHKKDGWHRYLLATLGKFLAAQRHSLSQFLQFSGLSCYLHLLHSHQLHCGERVCALLDPIVQHRLGAGTHNATLQVQSNLERSSLRFKGSSDVGSATGKVYDTICLDSVSPPPICCPQPTSPTDTLFPRRS